MFIILLVVGIFLAAECQALGRLPNTRYLGMGYNAVKGNPDHNLHDPGFVFSVLKFNWNTESTTSDGRYLVPDHIQGLQTMSCSFLSTVSKEFGARSYQNALSIDVKSEASYEFLPWKVRFSASVGYKTVSEGSRQHQRIYTSARAKCIKYQLSVNYPHVPITVTDDFAAAVLSLPLLRDDQAYKRFIDTFGTHFTSRVTMGAKMVIRSEFDQLALARMEQNGLNVEVGAKLSFLNVASGGLAVETSSKRQQRLKFEGLRKSYSASYLGSHPPSDGKWETWARSTAISPYPVKYQLAPLTALFSNKFFPGMSYSNLTAKRSLLSATYSRYCAAIAGCAIPPADRIPVRMKKVSSGFSGSAIVSCPPAYRLLSCGTVNIPNHNTGGAFDKRRYAVPLNAHSCKCNDNTGAVCVAWCTNTAVRFTIAKTGVFTGVGRAICPSGSKVMFRTNYY